MTFSMILPVLVVTLLTIILAMFWYSPWCLGPTWCKAHKMDNHRHFKATAMHYIGAILVALITAAVLAFLIRQFEITGWQCGMELAFYLWLGFIATTHFSGVIWAHKPFTVYLVDVLYHLLSLLMMGAVLASWY